jgi:pyridoxal phosphate enzyme (YggS family)
MDRKQNNEMSITQNLNELKTELPSSVTLVAVSKTKPNEAIEEAYATGQRAFGENKVQELVRKYESLPKDIQWHMIGHLQSNKVKYIAPFVSLIHGVDSKKLLKEINKQGVKCSRRIPVLLQMHIAEEDSKFGLNEEELIAIIDSLSDFPNVDVKGLMGMATFTDDTLKVEREFKSLYAIFEKYKNNPSLSKSFEILSMGMSGDYNRAISCGSTMVRLGSSIFGARNHN